MAVSDAAALEWEDTIPEVGERGGLPVREGLVFRTPDYWGIPLAIGEFRWPLSFSSFVRL